MDVARQVAAYGMVTHTANQQKVDQRALLSDLTDGCSTASILGPCQLPIKEPEIDAGFQVGFATALFLASQVGRGLKAYAIGDNL